VRAICPHRGIECEILAHVARAGGPVRLAKNDTVLGAVPSGQAQGPILEAVEPAIRAGKEVHAFEPRNNSRTTNVNSLLPLWPRKSRRCSSHCSA
jgi:hypothetical protein